MLALAAGLGIAADYLLRAASWRAGFALWVLLLLGAGVTLGRDDAAKGERRLLFAAAGVLASLLVLRDAPMLYALDFFGFVVVLFLIAWRAHGRPLAALEPRDALIGVASTVAAGAAGGPVLLLRDSDATNVDAGWQRSAKTFAIGSVAAIPVLLLVTGLLAEADPIFEQFLDRIGAFLELGSASHVIAILVATWLTAGALRGSLQPLFINANKLRGRLDLPFSAAAPVLGGLCLLLSVWIGLQLRSMFGGTAYIAAAAGVTVAEYARRGFFELIVIAGIALAVLLVADDLLDREDGAQRRAFHTWGTLLVALVGAVLISAVMRLALYLDYFGLTDDRVLALAVLTWVALVLLWFSVTVLRGMRARFAPGVLIISASWLGSLNIMNPERWVVEVNLRRAEAGMDFDIPYHVALSADATPTLLREANRLGDVRAAELRAALEVEWAQRKLERADWRRWSIPYWRSAR
jgi:hypothetical protein